MGNCLHKEDKEECVSIMDILREGDTPKLRKCLEDDVLKDKLKAQMDDIPTLILKTVQTCPSILCLEILINKGYNVNEKSQSNWSALHQAVYLKQWDMAQLLVESGADLCGCHPDFYDRWDDNLQAFPTEWDECYVPFAVAMQQSPKGGIPYDILLPDDINKPDLNPDPVAEQALGMGLEGFTMLTYSCMAWCLPAVRTLVEKGADVHKPADCGCLPIQVAMIFERHHNAKYLEPLTDLSLCKWNDIRKVKKALNIILYTKRSILREMLFRSLLDLDTPIEHLGQMMTPVMITCVSIGIDNIILQSLIDNGANINWVDPKTQRTALWWAVRTDQENKVKTLLESGADIFLASLAANDCVPLSPLKAYDGITRTTTMQMALGHRKKSLVELLVKHGCDFYNIAILYLDSHFTMFLSNQAIEKFRMCLEIPKTLAESAKSVIRSSIGYDNVQSKINALPVPDKLKTFLYSLHNRPQNGERKKDET